MINVMKYWHVFVAWIIKHQGDIGPLSIFYLIIAVVAWRACISWRRDFTTRKEDWEWEDAKICLFRGIFWLPCILYYIIIGLWKLSVNSGRDLINYNPKKPPKWM